MARGYVTTKAVIWPSWGNRLECVLGDAEIFGRIFPVSIALEVHEATIPGPHNHGCGQPHLDTTPLSAPVQDGEHEHVLAEVEKRLELGPYLLSLHLLHVSMPLTQPVMPVIGRTSDRRNVEWTSIVGAQHATSASMSPALNASVKARTISIVSCDIAYSKQPPRFDAF
jgi:hypothetical protein